MPRTAILYARSQRRAELDRQVRELQEWCDRAGVVPVETVAEVALGIRASKRCREVLAAVHWGNVWITSYSCPSVCEAILEPAQADGW